MSNRDMASDVIYRVEVWGVVGLGAVSVGATCEVGGVRIGVVNKFSCG